jgi:hypothetical protein
VRTKAHSRRSAVKAPRSSTSTCLTRNTQCRSTTWCARRKQAPTSRAMTA